MTKEFIIVIEADNKRVHAAYLKGLQDLELIWGQIEVACDAICKASDIEYHRQMEIYAKRVEHYTKIRGEIEEDFKAHDAWRNSCSWARGPEPKQRHSFFLNTMPHRPSKYTDPIKRYESIRAELKEMADLAGLAVAPFRMTEHKVKEMLGWEDGSKIEDIKKNLDKHPGESYDWYYRSYQQHVYFD